jgi:hypothetical protein
VHEKILNLQIRYNSVHETPFSLHVEKTFYTFFLYMSVSLPAPSLEATARRETKPQTHGGESSG